MGRRRTIDVPGLPMHRNPLPTAVRIGGMIFSSALSGMAREGGGVPDDAEAQICNVFANMKTVVEAAGAGLDDIAKVNIALCDLSLRPLVNRHWLATFPDPEDRPTRHTVERKLNANYVIQLDFVAVV